MTCKVVPELLRFLASVMAEPSKRSISWKRITIALATVFGLVFLLGMWIGPFYEARLMEEAESEVLPKPLPDAGIASDPAVRVERQGVSFGVPWNETDNSKRMASKSGMLILANGLGISVSRSPSELDAVKSLKGPTAAALRFELGDQALSSDFALISTAVSTRSSDAKWWHTPIYNRKIAFLLTLKTWRFGFPAESQQVPIYGFSEGRVRGFQVGDPLHERVVRLILFDETGREYQIDLLKFRGNISQAEINALIASLQFKT
jgi:hypothetical protein